MSFRSEVDALSNTFLTCFGSKDHQGCAAVYSEDAVLILSRTEQYAGRSAIASHFKVLLDQGGEVQGLTTLLSDADGQVGYAVQRIGDDGQLVMLALKKHSKGVWQVTCEVVVAG